jgi:hypothetical protein
MRPFIVLSTLVFVAGCLVADDVPRKVAGCVVADDLPRKSAPIVVITGTDSEQTKRSFARCFTEGELHDCWRKHRVKDEDCLGCPTVDFDSYMVVAIFYGKRRQDHGIWVREIVEEKECIRFRFQPNSYQCSNVPGSFKVCDTMSYAFVVLPKSTKELVLEEQTSGSLISPPVWTQQAMFPDSEKK